MIQNEHPGLQRWTDVLAGRAEPQDLAAVECILQESPMFQALGLLLQLGCGDCDARIEIKELQEYHRGGTTGDSVNGAIQALLFDAAIGCAAIARFPVLGLGSGVGRLDIRMKRPPRGPRVVVSGQVTKTRRNLVYARAELYAGEELCGHATGVVFIRLANGAKAQLPL